MATIAAYHLPLSGFALGVAIEADPAIRIELERVVPTAEGVLPFFWVWECEDFDRFERQVRQAGAIRSLTALSETGDGRLYRAHWNDEVEGFIDGMTRLGGTLLNGRGSRDGWRFELRFPERELVRTFLESCADAGVEARLVRLYTKQEISARDRYSLTEEQHETIQLAYEHGYFDEPRGVTQSDLAASFDISQRAVSRRLRRGLGRLVRETLVVNGEDPLED